MEEGEDSGKVADPEIGRQAEGMADGDFVVGHRQHSHLRTPPRPRHRLPCGNEI